MNSARWGHKALLLPNGKVLVASGAGLASAELYDPSTGTWTYTGSMHSQHGGAPLTLLPNGKVLVASGSTYDGGLHVVASAELYDPSTGTWDYTGSVGTAREAYTATLLPNRNVLIAGGDDFTTTFASAELYNLTSGTWSPAASMYTARLGHTDTRISNGKVLVTGGYGVGNAVLASAELYDPSTGVWTVTGSMNASRVGHTASLLRNGTVLVAGGSSDASELYNPSTSTWGLAGNTTTSRYIPTATLLLSGRVLLAGGLGSSNTALATAELSTTVITVNAPPHKVVVFLQGVCSSIKAGTGVDAGPFRDLQTLLKSRYGYKDADFLSYSYNGGSVDKNGKWYHNAYDKFDPVRSDFRTTSYSALHDQLLIPYHQQHPDATFVLVGHSLGGIVAMQEVLQDIAGTSYSAGLVSEVVTIDSPLHGIAPAEVVAGAIVGAQPCALDGIATGILVRDTQNEPATTNALDSTIATAAAKGVSVLNAGNDRDCLFDPSLCGLLVTGDINTQWVFDSAAQTYVASLPEPCQQVPASCLLGGSSGVQRVVSATHEAVLHDNTSLLTIAQAIGMR